MTKPMYFHLTKAILVLTAVLALLGGSMTNVSTASAQEVVAPMFIARLSTNVLEVYWWPSEEGLTATVYTDANMNHVLATGTGSTVGNPDDDHPEFYDEDISIPYVLAPGMYVTVKGNDSLLTKGLEIANITVDEMNTQSDMISGTVDLGLTNMLVRIWSSPEHLATRLPQAVNGSWSADFSQPGPDPEEAGTWNVVPCDYGVVLAIDNDGDRTSQPWAIPSAQGSTCAETPVGQNVVVSPSNWLEVQFGSVSVAGWTTVEAISSPPAVPVNFQLLGNAYEVSTSAEFTNAQVCFTYDDTGLSTGEEAELRLYHVENGDWVDRTDAGYPDTNVNRICGTVGSFSPFAVLLPTSHLPTTKNDCKNGGWKTFNTPRTFKNQGDCIQFVNTGK